MTSPEKKQMIGNRQSNNDGFTYSSGRFKFNKCSRRKSLLNRCKRADKRKVRNAENKRLLNFD